MRLILSIFVMLAVQLTTVAKDIIQISHDSYRDALLGKNRISFYLKTTNAGLVTTSSEGVAKKARIEFKSKTRHWELVISDLKLTIPSSSLDINDQFRNEIMDQDYLLTDRFKEIEIEIKGEVNFDGETDGSISILGLKHPIKLYLAKMEGGNKTMVLGQCFLSLNELDINNTSPWYARLDDTIIIKFHLSLSGQ